MEKLPTTQKVDNEVKYFFEVAPSKIIRSGSDSFTYSSSLELPIGAVVKIPVGKKEFIGVVIKKVVQPKYKTRDILEILYSPGIPLNLVKTALWLADYYSSPLASVVTLLLPSGITKKRRAKNTAEVVSSSRTKKVLTLDQQKASRKILENERDNKTSLLFGVTGSGKTQVYIDLALRKQQDGKSSIFLVPEISLTPQLVSEVSLHFPDLIVYHSRLTEAEKHLLWNKVVNSSDPIVVIGPRSALFLPINNLGLIAVDEEHEPSYKQDKTPRYSALRMARILASYNKASLILGSATPLIQDFYMAETSDGIVALPNPAQKNTLKPDLFLIDMTNRNKFKKHRFLSDELISAIEKNSQTLIYHNRRGSASITLCENCGWTAVDEETGLPLVLHIDKNKLVNHLTNKTYRVPTNCPSCGDAGIIHKGIGTKLIEQELRRLFPNKKIARFDGDNLSEETLEKSYDKLLSGEIDIIVGTQIVAKGLDLPHLNTVAVIQADAGLAIPDFASNERTFQLVSQVVGRVGRNQNKTNVIVQTYQKDSKIIKFAINQDYTGFYNYELAIRKKTNFPPYTYLLKLTCSYKTEAAAFKNARKVANEIIELYPNVQLFGPAPAFYEKIGDKYRWQIIVKAKNRSVLKEVAKMAPQPYWQFELDPTSLL